MKKIANFLFELGMLKREKHRGYLLTGLEKPKSVAEHSWRAAIIAYFLAILEKANPEKCAMMNLIHDFPEARLGDHHKVSARYFSTRKAEIKVFTDQIKKLPKEITQSLKKLFEEKVARKTREGIIAQDADWLEMALTAREYFCLGYKGMKDWINNVKKALETKSAKELLKMMEKIDINDWWQGLKKMTYRKLKRKLKRIRKLKLS